MEGDFIGIEPSAAPMNITSNSTPSSRFLYPILDAYIDGGKSADRRHSGALNRLESVFPDSVEHLLIIRTLLTRLCFLVQRSSKSRAYGFMHQ